MSKAALLAAILLATASRAGELEATFSAAERALLEEVEAGHLIKARGQAEKILASEPRSFAATWAMARVHHDEEGNHARALFFATRAIELLGDVSPQWGRKLMLEEYWITLEMNRNLDALAVLDRAQARFGPPPASLRIWPLFKVGREEEAQRIARRLTASDDWDDRAQGYNGLLSIAFEQHDRETAHRWALEGVQATQDLSCTLLRNAAGTAYTRFRLRESEELALRAGKAKDCADSVYNQLAGLYLVMGEFQKALSALESARTQPVEKRYRSQFAWVRRGALVDLLTVLGKGAEAGKLAAEVYAQPARTGMVSGSARVERLARTLRYALALDGQVSLLREQASYGPRRWGVLAELPELTGLLATRWEVRRAVLQLAAEDDRLVLLARPNIGEVNDWATWRIGDLIELLGTGVMAAAVDQARAADAAYPEATPYLDALAGEIAFRSQDLDEAERLASAALAGLPPEEALLRGRTLAWRAEVLRELGRTAEAQKAYLEVLQRWPTALRLLELSLPVTLATDGSELAEETGARLRRSRRFELEASSALHLRVDSRGPTVEICLLDDHGAQLACASGEGATKALEAFHSAAFSPKVSLTQSDLRSLDGSPVRVGADEALKGVLGQ
jgi:tetratricopeptide (TPR) repeat protein